LPNLNKMKPISPIQGRDETLDTFYHGRILVLQKKRGYRFAVDAPLLADFIRTEPGDRCLELGTGCGIVSLLLSIKPFTRITALEIQESLADLARRNVQLNRLEGRICVLHQDLRAYRPGCQFDVVFSNPPYLKGEAGALSPSREKSVAKHELECDVFGVMRKTAELLEEGGRAYFIFTAGREEEFVRAVEANGMCLKTQRYVLSRKGSPPAFFLAECRIQPGERKLLAPLVLFEERGAYSDEAREIFAGRSHDTPSP